MVKGKMPVPVAVPLRVAVPLWLSTNVTPGGKAPDSEIVGAKPTEYVTVCELVLVAESCTCTVNVCCPGVLVSKCDPVGTVPLVQPETDSALGTVRYGPV